jgi:hypothetical protein
MALRASVSLDNKQNKGRKRRVTVWEKQCGGCGLGERVFEYDVYRDKVTRHIHSLGSIVDFLRAGPSPSARVDIIMGVVRKAHFLLGLV